MSNGRSLGSSHTTGESIVRQLVRMGVREDGPEELERTLVRLALGEWKELERHGVVVEHDPFWEHNAREWAQQHPEIETAVRAWLFDSSAAEVDN